LSIAFDNNDILASGSDDSTIKLWNKNTGDLLRTIKGHNESVWSIAFDNNDILASGFSDGTIKLWNKNTGDLLRTMIIPLNSGANDYFLNFNKNLYEF